MRHGDELAPQAAAGQPPTTSQAAPGSTEANGASEQQQPSQSGKSLDKPGQKKGSKKKAKQAARELLANPDKIVESVLSGTCFKDCNLSQLTEEKFNAPDYKHVVEKALRGVQYEDIVTNSAICMSILPNLDGAANYSVCLDFTAVTALSCIYQQPEKRRHRKLVKKGANKQNKQQRRQQQQQQQQGTSTKCQPDQPTSRQSHGPGAPRTRQDVSPRDLQNANHKGKAASSKPDKKPTDEDLRLLLDRYIQKGEG